MIVGFNHNVTYRNVNFHVQTEDGGLKRPQLVTLLYHGGTIISSQKTSYADIIKVDALDHVVEELAKEQHKGMLRRLTKGEFDERIMEFGIPLGASTIQPTQQLTSTNVAAIAAGPVVAAQPEEPAGAKETPIMQPPSERVTVVAEPVVDKFQRSEVADELSLDDLIYAYLTAGQK